MCGESGWQGYFLVLTLRLTCSGILAELSEPQFLHLKNEHKDIYLTDLLRGLHVCLASPPSFSTTGLVLPPFLLSHGRGGG